MLGHQAGDVADAVDVRVAVLRAEAQALREVGPDLVAVEDRDVAAVLGQPLDEGVRDRALSRARQAGEPDRQALAEPGGLASLRISATAGRLNHSGSCSPLAR